MVTESLRWIKYFFFLSWVFFSSTAYYTSLFCAAFYWNSVGFKL